MASGIETIARTKSGTFQRLPFRRRAAIARLTVVTDPTITGTLEGGAVLTAVGGTYSAAVTRTGWKWKQADGAGKALASGTGATFTVAKVGVASTVTLSESVIDEIGRSTTGVSDPVDIPASTTAPAITSAPTLSPTTGAVGTAIKMTYGTVTGNPTPTSTRRLLLGTTLVGTGDSYTPVEADIGKVLTGEQTASNGVGTAAVRTSAGVSIVAASAVWQTVDTVSELKQALIDAPDGAVIEMTPGVKYGVIALTKAYVKKTPITVRAQDPANPPEFRGIEVTAKTPDTDKATYATILNIPKFDGLILENLKFVDTKRAWRNGPGLGEGSQAKLGTDGKYYVGSDEASFVPFATLLDDTKNITIRDCLFKGFAGSIYFRNCENFLFEYNTFEAWQIDACRFYKGARFGIFRNNKFWRSNANLSWDTDTNRHIDLLQFAADSGNNATDVLIENNHFEMTQGNSNAHGVFLKSEAVMRDGAAFTTDAVINNFTVRNNYFSGCDVQCITLAGCQNTTITGNRIVPGSQYTYSLTNNNCNPEIYILKGSSYPNAMAAKDCTISNNVWPIRAGNTDIVYGQGGSNGKTGVTVSGLTVSNNVGTTGANPTTVPSGWASTDVAQGKVGRRLNGVFIDN